MPFQKENMFIEANKHKCVKCIEFLGDTIYETWIGLKYFYYCF